MWDLVLKASKSLTKEMNLDGVLSFSSHHFFDKGFRKNNFFQIGSPLPFSSNMNLDFPSEKINNRKMTYITMADIDMDFDFGENIEYKEIG